MSGAFRLDEARCRSIRCLPGAFQAHEGIGRGGRFFRFEQKNFSCSELRILAKARLQEQLDRSLAGLCNPDEGRKREALEQRGPPAGGQ
jgi:hypothetical protein